MHIHALSHVHDTYMTRTEEKKVLEAERDKAQSEMRSHDELAKRREQQLTLKMVCVLGVHMAV